MLDTIEVLVTRVIAEAQGVKSWELAREDGSPLPSFTAGAHIDLKLANGLVRSYSLCNSQDEANRYLIAVNNDPQSRGGSKFIHDMLGLGDLVSISAPRNHFPLVEDAGHVVFVAGGIGITPIYSMIQRLEALGRSWELHYSARTKEMCAFRSQFEVLEQRRPGRVHFNFDHEPGGRMIDLKDVLAKSDANAHFYCCGPAPMLQAFEDAAKALGLPSPQIHVEYFTAMQEAATDGGFTVELARSKRSFFVSAGKTILETLLDNDVDVPSSCTQGFCGTCETAVIEGIPDHRDSVLSSEDQATNRTMMICCSGSKSEKLVLDL
ncbi:MAG: oxidoreductase [Silvibacterium sp.]|nr:oxidoreductase [Silvibacterium sp.]